MEKALRNLKVVGRNGVKASLDWANGYPVITIELESTTP